MTDYMAVITENQRRELLKYLEDRRGSYLAKTVVCGAALLITTMLSLPVYFGILDRRAVSYTPRGSFRTYRVAYAPPVLLFAFIVLLIYGFGRYYGPTSPISRVRRCDYTCARIIVSGKSPDNGKYPYYVYDSNGVKYCCPVYLDYRDAAPGSTMIGAAVSSGRRYAMADTAAPPKVDESVQRRLPPGL
ncbi:MAG: hypothetical protein J6Z45_05425 [Oscillospiraceae bacterium]|nr:hypothetical protein [Oscillospiraceae bacterium]